MILMDFITQSHVFLCQDLLSAFQNPSIGDKLICSSDLLTIIDNITLFIR